MIERISFEVHDILAGDNRAVILGSLVSKLKQTGKIIKTDFAIVLTVANREIVRFQMDEFETIFKIWRRQSAGIENKIPVIIRITAHRKSGRGEGNRCPAFSFESRTSVRPHNQRRKHNASPCPEAQCFKTLRGGCQLLLDPFPILALTFLKDK